MPIHLDPEDAWRKGLETRGTHWVTAELARLPGRPDDPLFDVVFVPPHPSWAFCQRWCAEEENRIRVAPTTLLAPIFVILALICVGRAAVGFIDLADSQAVQTQAAGSGAVGSAPTGSIMPTPNTIPGPPSTVAAGQSSVGGQTMTTTQTGTLPSVCGYHISVLSERPMSGPAVTPTRSLHGTSPGALLGQPLEPLRQPPRRWRRAKVSSKAYVILARQAAAGPGETSSRSPAERHQDRIRVPSRGAVAIGRRYRSRAQLSRYPRPSVVFRCPSVALRCPSWLAKTTASKGCPSQRPRERS
jgi:hypothetical protein